MGKLTPKQISALRRMRFLDKDPNAISILADAILSLDTNNK